MDLLKIVREAIIELTIAIRIEEYQRNDNKGKAGEPHEKWTAVYLSVDTRRMEAGQKSELNSWGSSTPKPLDSVRFWDTSAVPQKRAACPKITRLLSGRK